MTKEHKLMNELMVEAGKHDIIPLRLNSGIAYSKTGSVIKLCPPGTTDIVFIANHGRSIWTECKVYPYKPTDDQINFLKAVIAHGHIGIICYSFIANKNFVHVIEKKCDPIKIVWNVNQWIEEVVE